MLTVLHKSLRWDPLPTPFPPILCCFQASFTIQITPIAGSIDQEARGYSGFQVAGMIKGYFWV